MDRRSFLLWAGTAAGGLASAAGFWKWQEITPRVLYPGRKEGHFLRDRRALPPPSAAYDTDVVILGSGIAGLTAAWKMKREGHNDFLVIDGPEPYGNAAGGRFGELEFPTGAHYLPAPSQECFHVREILSDLGIILRNPASARPYYDERFILHAPQERLLIDGKWQEDLLPSSGMPQWERDEHKRFFDEIARVRALRDSNGKRLFTIPVVHSSSDPEWLALDRLTFRAWMEQKGYRSPSLHWYINYCCRDDFGAGHDQVSAWMGMHYFCSRYGEAENARDGAWITWPGGLQPLAAAIGRSADGKRKSGTAVSVKSSGKGVEVLCFEFTGNDVRSYIVRARKAICAMPLFVASRVVENIGEYGFDPAVHLPVYAPWMVSNFLMKDFPPEQPGAVLSWDNVVYRAPGLGYVVSTHQDIRAQPPEKTVFSAYTALSDRTPQAARVWLDTASPDELLAAASADLKAAYGWQFAPCVERVDITLRAHAMASPRPGFLSNAGTRKLRELDGPILFAHADLSGFSVFEEAAWWGYHAAVRAIA